MGDGTYTIVDAVAYVTERHGNYVKNVGYATLEEAIAACIDDAYRNNTYHANYANKTTEETVVLLQDITLDSDIVIPEGQSVIVELNGHKLTGTISGATIIDSKNTPAPEEDETSESEN